MSELYDNLLRAVSWDETRMENLHEFIEYVEKNVDTEQPISIFVREGQYMAVSELRLSYVARSFPSGKPEVLVISRQESTDAIAETIVDLFRIEGIREARVVKHHQYG